MANKYIIFLAMALLLVSPVMAKGLSPIEEGNLLEKPDLKDLNAKQVELTDRLDNSYIVKDKEGKTIADYTLTTKKPKTKEVWGVKYADIKYQEKKLKKILKDESSSFRHDKDMDTLKKIREGNAKW